MELPVRTDLQEDPYKERLTPYESFAAVSLLEYGGLKHILPFLGGRSDAARRVVIRPSWPHLRRPYGFSDGAIKGSHHRIINHDAARRVATIFEKWDCLLEPIYKKIPIKKD